MTDHHEIVIIRRGGSSELDDHHGGVWKIAFADFMTAMMAFFLVMWLISANDKTRASVARYFNPVRLVDATTQPPGLHDPKKDDSGLTASANTKDRALQAGKARDVAVAATGDSGHTAETAAGRQQRLDKALLENPYAALAEIVATKGPSDVAARTQEPRPAAVMGLNGGEQFRDPFAPPPPPTTADDDEAVDALGPPPSPGAQQPGGAQGDQAKPGADPEPKTLAAALKDDGTIGPTVDVRRTSEGLLVSLTDTANFAMFANGSAVPSRRVVLMMEHVAQVLKARAGSIVVRGFTDNKPFHSSRYDNWRLSLDRAQVAHYMLVRGGLPNARIDHVEGYADRASRPGVDPGSPLNRRIEILLKDRVP